MQILGKLRRYKWSIVFLHGTYDHRPSFGRLDMWKLWKALSDYQIRRPTADRTNYNVGNNARSKKVTHKLLGLKRVHKTLPNDQEQLRLTAVNAFLSTSRSLVAIILYWIFRTSKIWLETWPWILVHRRTPVRSTYVRFGNIHSKSNIATNLGCAAILLTPPLGGLPVVFRTFFQLLGSKRQIFHWSHTLKEFRSRSRNAKDLFCVQK